MLITYVGKESYHTYISSLGNNKEGNHQNHLKFLIILNIVTYRFQNHILF